MSILICFNLLIVSKNFLLNDVAIAGAFRAIYKTSERDEKNKEIKEEIRSFLVRNIPDDVQPPYDYLIRIGIDAIDYNKIIKKIEERINK